METQPPIYFENFPDNCSRTELLNFLSNFTSITHLHVAQNKNNRGRRFGFIHIRIGYNLNRVVDILNERWFGSYKLRANIALFDKHKRRHFTSVPHVSSPAYAQGEHFIDASKPPFRSRSSSMIYNKNGTTPEWLSRSSLGVLKSLDLLTQIHNAFIAHEFEVEIKPLGGCEVIVSFPSIISMKETYENNSWIFDYLDVWRPWQCRDIASGRFIWLNVIKVPLHIWETKFFNELVIDLGEFICVSKETERKDRLDIAKVLICVSGVKPIDTVINVHVDGEVFDIRIFEDKSQDFVLDLNQSFKSEGTTLSSNSKESSGKQESLVNVSSGSPQKDDIPPTHHELPIDNSVALEELKTTSQDPKNTEILLTLSENDKSNCHDLPIDNSMITEDVTKTNQDLENVVSLLTPKAPSAIVTSSKKDKTKHTLRMDLRAARKKAREIHLRTSRKSKKIAKNSSLGFLSCPDSGSTSSPLVESTSHDGIDTDNAGIPSPPKELDTDSRAEAEEILKFGLQMGFEINCSWDEAIEDVHNLVLEDRRQTLAV